ncbi:21366_t:CDS:2, partial [Rhizophagus irregularis]
ISNQESVTTNEVLNLLTGRWIKTNDIGTISVGEFELDPLADFYHPALIPPLSTLAERADIRENFIISVESAIVGGFNSGAVHHEKPLEEKEMDSCLLEAHKKIVSEDIRRRNKEKKLQRESANQDVTFGNAYVSETVVVAPQLVIADTPQEEIPTVDSKVTHDIKAVNRHPENSYEDAHRMIKPDLEVSIEQDDEQESLDKNQIIEQGLIQELCGTLPLAPSANTCSPIS